MEDLQVACIFNYVSQFTISSGKSRARGSQMPMSTSTRTAPKFDHGVANLTPELVCCPTRDFANADSLCLERWTTGVIANIVQALLCFYLAIVMNFGES